LTCCPAHNTCNCYHKSLFRSTSLVPTNYHTATIQVTYQSQLVFIIYLTEHVGYYLDAVNNQAVLCSYYFRYGVDVLKENTNLLANLSWFLFG